MLIVTFKTKDTGRNYKFSHTCAMACQRFLEYLMNVSFVESIEVRDAEGNRVYDLSAH